MDLMNYVVSLKNFKEKEVFLYQLSDNFWKAIESPDIKKGTVEVQLTVTKKAMFFEFLFQMRGEVEVPCNRCLEPMSFPISTEKLFHVKIGETFCDDGDDTITVAAADEELDVAWLMYETIALSVPIQHVHACGDCDPTMSDYLRRCLVEENLLSKTENSITDPRWEKLKDILDE